MIMCGTTARKPAQATVDTVRPINVALQILVMSARTQGISAGAQVLTQATPDVASNQKKTRQADYPRLIPSLF